MKSAPPCFSIRTSLLEISRQTSPSDHSIIIGPSILVPIFAYFPLNAQVLIRLTWNLIPFELRSLLNLSSFKRNLRNYSLHQRTCLITSTSGSRTSETVGPNFSRNLLTAFFRRFPQKIQHFPP